MANLNVTTWYTDSGPTIGIADLTSNNNAAGATLAIASAVIPNNALVVVLVNEATSTSTGSLSDGTNTYTAGPTEALGGSAGFAMVFYHYYTTGGTFTLTYTKKTSGVACTMAALYATGVASSTPLDSAVTAVSNGTSITPTVTSGTPSTSGELIIGFAAWSNASARAFTQQTAPPAFLAPPAAVTTQSTASVGGGSFQYCGVNPITFNPTLATSVTGTALIIVGFKPAAAPTEYYAVTPWAQTTAKTCGNLIRQNLTPTVGNERVFVCGVAGTTLTGTEPTWTATRYGATTDNTVTWYECTGNPAVNGDLTNALTWAQQHTSSIAVTTGLIIYDSTSGSLQIITTAGNLGSSVPTFSATAGTTVNESVHGGTAVWTSLGAASGFQYWKAPHARLANATAWATSAATTQFFLGDDHAETQATAISLFATSLNTSASVYSVDHTQSLPTTSLKTGASLTTTGSSNLVLYGSSNAGVRVYWYGITFNCGSGANSPSMQFCAQTTTQSAFVDTCALNIVATGSTAEILCGALRTHFVRFTNTTVSFGAVGQTIVSNGCAFEWIDTASAITGSIYPTVLFSGNNSARSTSVTLRGLDLGAFTGTIFGGGLSAGQGWLFNCKLNASVTIIVAPAGPGLTADLVISDSTGAVTRMERWWYEGTLKSSTNVVRTGGAALTGTPVSWAITTTANSLWFDPFWCPSTWINNSTTGSNVAVIIYGIWFGAALPNNDQIWHDVEYFGSSGSPLAYLASGTKANALASGSAWSADTSAWDSAAAARANSAVYAVGNIFKQSGSPGSLFIVTAIGSSPHQSAASPPAGYTGAADGAVIADGNLTVQAGYRFSMTVTLSSPQPQLAGYLHTYVKAALASSTFYVDPQIVL